MSNPASPPPGRPRRQGLGLAGLIKRRLMDRVADEQAGAHLTVPLQAGTWRTLWPGVRVKALHETPEALSYLLELAPGAWLPAHRHRADEECIVIQGQVSLGRQVHGVTGTYHLARAGTLHPGLRSDTGALLFLRGARPHLRDVFG